MDSNDPFETNFTLPSGISRGPLEFHVTLAMYRSMFTRMEPRGATKGELDDGMKIQHKQ